MDTIPTVYLSRRNLVALLSKLDRVAAGDFSACTIIKSQGPNEAYQQTMSRIVVVAVDDEEYYGAQNRPASEMYPADEVKLGKPSTGILPIEEE